MKFSKLLKLLILYYLFKNDNKIVEDVINISDEEKNVKRKGERQRDPVWNHFKSKLLKTLGHFSAKCKHYGTNFSREWSNQLEVHLAKDCTAIALDIKNNYQEIIMQKQIIKEKFFEIEQVNKRQKLSITDYWSNKNQVLSENLKNNINRSITIAFIMCDLPFSIIENSWFVDALKLLWSNYNLPIREYLVSLLLNNEAIRINYEIKIVLKNSKNLTLGIVWLYNYN